MLGYQPEVGFTELYRSAVPWLESTYNWQVHNNQVYAFWYNADPPLSGYVKIYDLTNGYIPVFADSMHFERMADDFEIQPPLMIAWTYDNDVLVYDISGTNDAELVGYYNLPGYPRAFEVDLERQMVLAASRGYIAVLDISDALTLADIERESPNPLVSHFGITSVFPNPFNASTQIRYSVNRTGPVTIDLYNVLGQRVTNLLNDTRQPGLYTLNLSGENLPTGQYFVRMLGSSTDVARITLIK
ncbi:MAG: T9SS type A sorting domain-containing protein [bacterium]|nr:T9SS type A sorting domain-containing protein [bacterium]